ncbi:MAG: hypothetical protein ACKO6N_05670 [Myxococcota bacterium]
MKSFIRVGRKMPHLVVAVELDPSSKQSDLVRAIQPVYDRVKHPFDGAKAAFIAATANGDDAGVEEAREEIDALLLFKNEIGAYLHLYRVIARPSIQVIRSQSGSSRPLRYAG